MADKQENMRLLHDTIIYCLTENERRFFVDVLGEFQNRRDRIKFVSSLRRLLNTAGKQEVVPYLLAILPPKEREIFLQLWMRTSNYNAFYGPSSNNVSRPINSRNSNRSAPSSYTNPYAVLERRDRNANRNVYSNSLPLQTRQKAKSVTFKPTSPTLSDSQRSLTMPKTSPPRQNGKSKTHVVKLKRENKQSGFGFSVRGGAENGLGIFVSSVEEDSIAEKKNLMVGDQIIKLNEHNFQNIESGKAVQIIQENKKLKMVIFSSGLVPESKQACVEYQWVNVRGQPCSPPINSGRSERNTSKLRNYGGIRLLQDESERRVILHVYRGVRLGLKIRGGLEYGLGVYVSSVDRNHVAEKSGIQVGDQILNVNGVDFTEISHRDAVRVLKSHKIMNMVVKGVGKIPYSRTVLEKTEWLDDKAISRSSSMMSLSSNIASSPKIRQGIAGSQLLHQSTIVAPIQRTIEEKARSMLTDSELQTLKYYLSEYCEMNIHVEGLVGALVHLLKSPEKLMLFGEIRSLIKPEDVGLYDLLLYPGDKDPNDRVSEKEKQSTKESFVESNTTPSWSPVQQGNVLFHQSALHERNRKLKENPSRKDDTKLSPKVESELRSQLPVNDILNSAAEIKEEIIAKKDASNTEDMPCIDDLSFEDDGDDDYETLDDIKPVEKSRFQDIKETTIIVTLNEERRSEADPKTRGEHSMHNDQQNIEDDGNFKKMIDEDSKVDSVEFSLMKNALLTFSNANYDEESDDDDDYSRVTYQSLSKEKEREMEDIIKKALAGKEEVIETHEANEDDLRPGFRLSRTPQSILPTEGSQRGKDRQEDITDSDYNKDKDFTMDLHLNYVGDIEKDGTELKLDEEERCNETFPNHDDYDADFADDLEFEFEEEPEVEEDEVTSPLKFAPIRIQEIATSYVFEDERKDGFVEDEKTMYNTVNEASVSIQERQRVEVADVAVKEPMRSSASSNEERRVMCFAEDEFEDKNDTKVYSLELNSKMQRDDVYTRQLSRDNIPVGNGKSPIAPRLPPIATPLPPVEVNSVSQKLSITDESSVLQLPDRSLTKKRFNIISYEGNNMHENQVQREFGLIKPLKKVNAENNGLARTSHDEHLHEHDEPDHLKSTFNKLRSIFEFQRPVEPKSEYLSEIIKKNTDLGRRRGHGDHANNHHSRSLIKLQDRPTKQDSSGYKMEEIEMRASLEYQPSTAESDISSVDDFDFSSISPRIQDRLPSIAQDDKLEISSGYGSEDYFNGNEIKLSNVRIEKDRPELGLVLATTTTKTQERGVQIKEILVGDKYAACLSKGLRKGQEIVSVDGEKLQGLSPSLAESTLKRNYRNPCGSFHLAARSMILEARVGDWKQVTSPQRVDETLQPYMDADDTSIQINPEKMSGETVTEKAGNSLSADYSDNLGLVDIDTCFKTCEDKTNEMRKNMFINEGVENKK
eukprot:gene15946-17549_t